MITVRAVELAGLHATVLEIGVQSRTGMDRCDRVFGQFLVAVDEAGDLSLRALDACLGREAFSAFTRGLETSIGRGVVVWFAWHTSILYAP